MMCGCASANFDEHLVNTSRQLVMTREDTSVKDVQLVSFFDLHLDPALVPRHSVLLRSEQVAFFVLDSDLKEEPG